MSATRKLVHNNSSAKSHIKRLTPIESFCVFSLGLKLSPNELNPASSFLEENGFKLLHIVAVFYSSSFKKISSIARQSINV